MDVLFCRDYKIPDGKPANQYGYNAEVQCLLTCCRCSSQHVLLS